MSTKPVFPNPRIVTTIVVATLSALIAICLLYTVTGLFQRDGVPFEQVVIAERACADYAFVSEREACVRAVLAASRVRNLASR